MLKYLAILWLLLSFALMQVHNFTPHLHSKGVNAVGHEHASHNHGHDHKPAPPVTNDYPSQPVHSEDFGNVVTKPQDGKRLEVKAVYSELFIVSVSFVLLAGDDPPQALPLGIDTLLHPIFVSHSVPLRAPPYSLTA